MSDIYQALNVVAFVSTILCHVFYLVVGIRSKKWRFTAKVGGVFSVWLLVTILWLGFGIEPFGFLYSISYYGISIFLVYLLRNYYTRASKRAHQSALMTLVECIDAQLLHRPLLV